ITSLERGLQALAAKMNRDQDILFLYLTTHGSEDHRLSFDQSGLDLPDLSADELADMLDNSGIKWKVVVLSACYSGGFIEPLKNEQTLILTAAAADKTSFGCSDNRQFTYFGDALFQQSLAKTDSFSAAFDQAVTLINEWENEEELEPSNPQSHQPEPIMEQLRRWRRTLVVN
ncbi:MAG: C13 family peptidase, partial [Gammaproteobacteria bacterium]